MPPKRKQHSKVACCNVYSIGQNMQAWSNHNISELGLRALWFLEHLQEFVISTWHPFIFEKTRKKGLQQFGKQTWQK